MSSMFPRFCKRTATRPWWLQVGEMLSDGMQLLHHAMRTATSTRRLKVSWEGRTGHKIEMQQKKVEEKTAYMKTLQDQQDLCKFAVDAILPWSTGSRHALPADLGAERAGTFFCKGAKKSMAVHLREVLQANGYCCDGDTFCDLQVDAGLIVLALYCSGCCALWKFAGSVALGFQGFVTVNLWCTSKGDCRPRYNLRYEFSNLRAKRRRKIAGSLFPRILAPRNWEWFDKT